MMVICTLSVLIPVNDLITQDYESNNRFIGGCRVLRDGHWDSSNVYPIAFDGSNATKDVHSSNSCNNMSDWMDNPKKSMLRLNSVDAIVFSSALLPKQWLDKFNKQMTKESFNALDAYLYFSSHPDVVDAMFNVIQKHKKQLASVIAQDGK